MYLIWPISDQNYSPPASLLISKKATYKVSHITFENDSF